MQHHFNIEIAKKFGTDIAIFLDHMAFWTIKNMANNKHFYDGAYWTRNKAEAYTVIFPYWTEKQIRKILLDCERYGLINIGNYNKTKYDRTGWHSLTEYSAKLLNISIFPNGKMEVPKKENRSSQKGTAIPDTNTDTDTSLKSFYKNEKKHDFAESMNQMASEKRHIEEHEKVKHNPVPENLRGLLPLYKKNEQTRPIMRDFTQERLDREEREEREARKISCQ